MPHDVLRYTSRPRHLEQLPIFCHSRYGRPQSEFCQGPSYSGSLLHPWRGMTTNLTAACRELNGQGFHRHYFGTRQEIPDNFDFDRLKITLMNVVSKIQSLTSPCF